jgi:hypothetical protein
MLVGAHPHAVYDGSQGILARLCGQNRFFDSHHVLPAPHHVISPPQQDLFALWGVRKLHQFFQLCVFEQ